MIQVSVKNDFEIWRKAARRFILQKTPPNKILWCDAVQEGLFTDENTSDLQTGTFNVSKDFIELAKTAACFDDAEKWNLLYRILFRLIWEDPNLLHIESDADIRRARLMERGVRRDIHKFHAFVRFQKVEIENEEVFTAWHEPLHFTVKAATPFFARRFGAMRFSILTPKGCAHWDLRNLIFTEGVSRPADLADETEELWLAYYRSIFNPFRLKIKAMKSELPVRHWRTLPEAKLIPDLIRDAKQKLNA